MSALQKNVASQHIGFCLNSTAAGAPVTAGGAGTVVIDGGSQAACGGSFTHKGTGQWDYAPTQAETNGTSISFAFTGTGAIQVGMQFFTIGYNPTLANVPANATQLAGQTITAAAGVTFPTSVASPTNITAGTIATVTTLTNLPSIPANWLTAAGINAAALNGKGDWNTTTPPTVAAIATGVWQDSTAGDFTTASSVGKSLYNAFTAGTSVYTVAALANAPSGTGASAATIATAVWQDTTAGDFTTAGSIGKSLGGAFSALGTSVYTAPALANAPSGTGASAATIATAVWQDSTAGDFTVSASVGKSIMNGVALGTGLTINGYTGNTAQTGDSYARIGALGAGLTGITGVTLGATQAGVTIPTVTNLTNAPTAGDLTTTMKTSVTTAATAATPTIAGYTGNTAQTGDAYARLGAPVGASTSADIAAVKSDIDAGVAVTSNVKKNTALAGFTFVLTDSTSHAPKTGVTVTAQRSLNGGALGSCTNAAAEISNGLYKIDLSAADLNANVVLLRFTGTATDDRDILIITQP